MNKKEENSFTMLQAVITLIKEYQGTFTSIPAFGSAQLKLENIIKKIEAKNTQLGNATAGKTSAKEKHEKELIKITIEISSGISLYSISIGDEELKKISKITQTQLKRLRDTELLGKARDIFNRALPLAAYLTPYSITAEKINALNTAIKNYEQGLGQRELSLAEKTAAREELTNLFKEAGNLLKEEIDKYVELIKNSSPDVYNRYRNARYIKDMGMRHSAEVEETVTEGK